jgi:YfiH family protein
MELILPNWVGAPANVGAFCTLRSGGVSVAPYGDGSDADGKASGNGLNLGLHVGDDPAHVARNRGLLQSILPASPVWLTQVHGTQVLELAADAAQAASNATADASFSTQSNVVCVMQTADCLPVLFCDTQGRVVAAAHAGWRGLAHGVLANTVAGMRAAGAGEILAWLGPAIGPQQFEVGADVLAAFPDAADAQAFRPLPGPGEKYLADIYQLARNALLRVGVRQVWGGQYCTVSDPQRFYSYRRDRVTGRMASLIWLK